MGEGGEGFGREARLARVMKIKGKIPTRTSRNLVTRHASLVTLYDRIVARKMYEWPDHGLFAHGTNRLYVHRGTGFYGFPLRIGVPGEASVLEVFAD